MKTKQSFPATISGYYVVGHLIGLSKTKEINYIKLNKEQRLAFKNICIDVLNGFDEYIIKKNRTEYYTILRAYICDFLKEKYSVTYVGLGEILNRDHSTIINYNSIVSNDYNKKIYKGVYNTALEIAKTIGNRLELELYDLL